MEKYAWKEMIRPEELPGEWLDLSGKEIEKVGSRNKCDGCYVIESGTAIKFNAIGRFAEYNGVIMVGAPDGNLKVAPASLALIASLEKVWYQRAAMMVPNLFSGYERFSDPATQLQFENMRLQKQA